MQHLLKRRLVEEFNNLGYVKLGKLFDTKEVDHLKSLIKNSSEMNLQKEKIISDTAQGRYASFETIHVMNDVTTENDFSLACRKPAIIDFVSDIFDDDAYLYHSKVPLKYPGVPGFKYHQDYYYWYQMGCVFPNMATCFIALDKSTQNNGCLKYIPRSHSCGRLEHILHDGFSDSECDPVRVEHLKKLYGEVSMELEPGEVVLHHCNMLHASEKNESAEARLALLGCFNTKRNDPLPNDSGHPSYFKQARFHGKLGIRK